MHEQWQDMLPLYINGTLSDVERDALEQHLAQCDECRAAAEEWLALSQVASAEIKARQNTLPQLILPGNSHNARYRLYAHRDHQLNQWEDKTMVSSTAMRMSPGSTRHFTVPLTLLVTAAMTLLVSALLIFNSRTGLPYIFTTITRVQEVPTPAEVFERYIEDVWNAGNFESLDGLLAPEFTQYDAALPQPLVGAEALQTAAESLRGNLPGVTFAIEQIVTDGNTIFARLTAAGNGFSVPMTASAEVIAAKLSTVWFDATALMETQLAEWVRISGMENWNNPATEDRALNLFHRAAIEHGLFGNKTIYPDGQVMWIRFWQYAFPDLECTYNHVAAEADIILIQSTCDGTFEKSFSMGSPPTIEPTGRHMQWVNYYVFRVEEGKVKEFWWTESNPLFWQLRICALTGSGCP